MLASSRLSAVQSSMVFGAAAARSPVAVNRKHVFHYGPSTSSVWSTPSWDEESNAVFFGTDVHNSARKPSEDDARNYTEHSATVIAVNAADCL